ncbi:hypothetical protein ACP4OV_031895 [Aristida adscensionis]
MTKKMTTRGALAIWLLAAAAALCAAAAMEMVVPDTLPLGLEAGECPPQVKVEEIVRKAVLAARQSNNKLTAGLLRIFFHDCFLEGCDASVFLPGERNAIPNQSLQQEALDLIENIRRQVHAACGGPKVSCADILAFATRDAVVAAGVPHFNIVPGRMDSREPARNIGDLPFPGDDVAKMLDKFTRQGLTDATDLVALSGGHTIGKTSCNLTRKGNDAFSKTIFSDCQASRSNQHSLDVITPEVFDNQYFVALTRSQGVLFSDQALTQHDKTAWLVNTYAGNNQKFLTQFAASMMNLSRLKGPGADQKKKAVEIRFNCFSPNPPRIDLNTATARVDEGLAALA